MNLANYDRTFLSTAEIISAFFTNVFVNKLYLIALSEFRENNHNSITDAFKRVISNYSQGISRNYKHYKSVISLLHAYYQDKTRYSTIVFSDFEDNVLRQFIPEEYFDDFTSKEKDKTLYDIVVKVVHNVYVEILKPDMLAGIIDDRRDNTYALILKDKIISLLAIQHEEYYAKFATKIQSSSRTVSIEVAQKLKAALIEETKRRCEIEAEKDKAVEIIYQLIEKIERLKAPIREEPKIPQNVVEAPRNIPKQMPIEQKITEQVKVAPKNIPAEVKPAEIFPKQESPKPAPESLYKIFDEDFEISDIGFGG